MLFARPERAVDGPVADVRLQAGGVGGVMEGHGGNHFKGLVLANVPVPHESLDAYLEGGGGQLGGQGGLPVENPAGLGRNLKLRFLVSEEVVSDQRNSFLETKPHRVLNYVNNSFLEEDIDEGGEGGPDVSVDMDVDVKPVDFDIYVEGVEAGNDTAIWQHLCIELNAKSNCDRVHLHVEVTFGNDRPFLLAEVVAEEVGVEFVSSKDDRVVGFVGNPGHVLGCLID